MRHLAPLAALLAVACSPVQFAAQDVRLTHDAEKDRLELVLEYHGLTEGTEQPDPVRPDTLQPAGEGITTLDKSVAWLRRLAAGERVFILAGWPLIFDLEEADELAPEEDRRLLDAVTLVEATLFLDEDERLCARQRLRWDGVTAGLARVNEALTQALASSYVTAPEGEEDQLSPASRALFEAHLREERTWIALTDGGVDVTIPLTLEDVAASQDEAADLDAVAEAFLATSATVDERGVHLRYAPDEDGVVQVRFDNTSVEVEPKLRDRMVAAGLVKD